MYFFRDLCVRTNKLADRYSLQHTLSAVQRQMRMAGHILSAPGTRLLGIFPRAVERSAWLDQNGRYKTESPAYHDALLAVCIFIGLRTNPPSGCSTHSVDRGVISASEAGCCCCCRRSRILLISSWAFFASASAAWIAVSAASGIITAYLEGSADGGAPVFVKFRVPLPICDTHPRNLLAEETPNSHCSPFIALFMQHMRAAAHASVPRRSVANCTAVDCNCTICATTRFMFLHVPKTAGSSIEAIIPADRQLAARQRELHRTLWGHTNFAPWHLPPDVYENWLRHRGHNASAASFSGGHPVMCVVRHPLIGCGVACNSARPCAT